MINIKPTGKSMSVGDGCGPTYPSKAKQKAAIWQQCKIFLADFVCKWNFIGFSSGVNKGKFHVFSLQFGGFWQVLTG